jgi:hypothetical protein
MTSRCCRGIRLKGLTLGFLACEFVLMIFSSMFAGLTVLAMSHVYYHKYIKLVEKLFGKVDESSISIDQQ